MRRHGEPHALALLEEDVGELVDVLRVYLERILHVDLVVEHQCDEVVQITLLLHGLV